MDLKESIDKLTKTNPDLAHSPFLLYSMLCDEIKNDLRLKKEAYELYVKLASSENPAQILENYNPQAVESTAHAHTETPPKIPKPPTNINTKPKRPQKPKPPIPPDNAMVFFTPENGFYHLSDDCGKLKKSRLIFQTTYGDAKDCDLRNPYPTPKKRHLCPSCGFATPRLKTESRLKKKLKFLTDPYPEIKLWKINRW